MLEINTKKTVRKGKTYDLQSLFDFTFEDKVSPSEQDRIKSLITWKGSVQVGEQRNDIPEVPADKEKPRSLSLITDKSSNSILIPSDVEGKITLEASFQVGEEIITTQVTFNVAEDLSKKKEERASQVKSVRSEKSREVRKRYDRISRE